MKPALFRRKPSSELNTACAVIPNAKESGVALIISLLLLVLMSILGLGMVLAVSSDMYINGYYGNYRSAFYAADSGLNLVRQQLTNQIVTNVSTSKCASWGAANSNNSACTYYPLTNAATLATTAITSVQSTYGSFVSLKEGQSASSWPGQFKLSSASTFALSSSPPAACGYAGGPTCQYSFQYNLISIGKGPGYQQVVTSEVGYLNITVTQNGTAGATNFAQFGTFINSFADKSNPLVYGTYTGKQWTNGTWNFGSGGNYTFAGPVYEAGPVVSYDFSGQRGCNPYCYVDSASPSVTYGSQTIAPNFQAGFQVNAGTASMPDNSFNQEYAVLDGCGNRTTCPSESPTINPATLNTFLQNSSGTKYPLGGATSGVYLPASGGMLTGGGIYVEGGVTSITLTPGTDGSGNLTQSYAILQNNTTTTVTTCIACNSGAGKTTMGGATYVGVPHNTAGTAQTMLYVNGNIGPNYGTNPGNYTGLTGPNPTDSNESSVAGAAIQDGVKLTIVANGDINVVGNLKYKQEPVKLDTTDASVPANDKGQVLGLFTSTGDIVLNSPYSDNNLQIDGAIAAVGSTCSQSSMQANCGFQTSGNIGTFTIVGGRSEANAHGVNMNQMSLFFDTRFSNGTAPPWFPSTTVTGGAPGTPIVTPTFSKLNWFTSSQ